MEHYAAHLEPIRLQQQRMARFFKVAFHCHSPLSGDWGKRSAIDKQLNDRSRLLSDGGEIHFVQEAVRRCGCDMMVITDHMKCAYAEKLLALDTDRAGVAVLPGMEVNFLTNAIYGGVRLHIIVILPPTCRRETFARLLPGVDEEHNRRDSDLVEGQDLRRWIDCIHQHGGLAIAAHVASSNGIRCCFRHTAKSTMALLSMEPDAQQEQARVLEGELKNLILDAGFDGVEIRRPDDSHHYRWVDLDGEKRRITTVLGFDGHCFEDYDRKDHVTIIKMTTPDIESLGAALKFPETRVRFANDLAAPPSPTLLGICMSGNDESFFTQLHCAFSPNLNCVIGPRGSGKSTLVEALRYALGYNRTLSELDVTNRLSDRIRDLQKHNLCGSLIRMFYRKKNGELRVLEATYDPKQDYATRVFNTEGQIVPTEDVEKCGDYPLRLYGWSEIETLGRDQARQRMLLDRMVPGLKEAIEHRDSSREKLQRNREAIKAVIRELQDKLNQDGGDIHKFQEYLKDFQELDKPEVRTCFHGIDLMEAKTQLYRALASNCQELLDRITDIEPNALAKGMDATAIKLGVEVKEWWRTEDLRVTQMADTQRFVMEETAKIQAKLEEMRVLVQTRIDDLRQNLEREYAAVRAVLSGEPDKQRIADLRRNAKKRLDKVSAIREQYMESWTRLRNLVNDRRTMAVALARAQDEVTVVRAKTVDAVQHRLSEFTGDNLKVSVHMVRGGDKSEFTSALESFLRAPHARINKKLLTTVHANFTPVSFGNLLLERRWDDLKGDHVIDGATVATSDGDVQKLKEMKDWYDHSDPADVDRVIDDGDRLIDILTLQETPWDDCEAILLNGQPVDRLSPGQRSSAMLPLIALAEDAPLVIDQPEDNLDNRLVGHVLVDILAALKERRQIIVCTHNPNIVVSGDAEQVIVLRAESNRKGELDTTGSIDSGEIVSTVIDLMEGGREAFKMRRERYGM